MRTLTVAIVALILAGSASSAQASCVALESLDPFAEVERSPVAFIGTANPGDQDGGALLSPAVFTVERRLDRWKRASERVRTEITREPNGGTGWTEDGLSIKAGERWLILGRRFKGQVSASSCGGVFNTVVDGSATPTLRFPGLKSTVTPDWTDTRGQSIDGQDGPLRLLPHWARALRADGITAARRIHRGKVQTLSRSKGWWRYPAAVTGDRIVVATKNGFWSASIR